LRCILGDSFWVLSVGMNSNDKIVQVFIADGIVDLEFRLLLIEAVENKAILLLPHHPTHQSPLASGALAPPLLEPESFLVHFLLYNLGKINAGLVFLIELLSQSRFIVISSPKLCVSPRIR
jgi:hypothetical protein